jgi:hypothetical protein
MGLAQKRIVQEFQTTKFSKWKSEFDAIVGCEIPMEVKWDTLQSDKYDKQDQYFAWYDAVYFRPLKDVFTSICKDQMGKDAVKAGVKKIVIDGTKGHAPEHTTFANGVLTVNHIFSTNIDSMNDRVRVWTKLVESKL